MNELTAQRKKRLPISAAQVKALAFKYELLVDVAAVVNIPLRELIEQHEELSAAWDHGQFLRRLWIVGRECYTESQAAGLLGIDHEEFARLLKQDCEARQLWIEARIHLQLDIKRRVLASVENGKLSTFNLLKLLNGCFDIHSPSEYPPDDVYHVHPKTLAKLLGVSRVTLDSWRKEHGLQRNTDGRTYRLDVVLPWLRRWERAKIERKSSHSKSHILPTS